MYKNECRLLRCPSAAQLATCKKKKWMSITPMPISSPARHLCKKKRMNVDYSDAHQQPSSPPVWVCLCMYICMDPWTKFDTCPACQLFVYMCICVCVYVCVTVFVCVRICACTYVHTQYIQLSITYACVYTHTIDTHTVHTHTQHTHTHTLTFFMLRHLSQRKKLLSISLAPLPATFIFHIYFFKKNGGGKWTCFPFSSLHFVHASPHFTNLFQVLPLYMV